MKKNLAIILLIMIVFVLLFVISITTVSAGVASGCNYHAYRDCSGSSLYWFDSCGNKQDLIQNCPNLGQICRYGQCVSASQSGAAYSKNFRIACYENNLHWYDSLGVVSGLHKNCADSNSCTVDACSSDKCSNALKCDGSTCAKESADYCNNCQHIGDAVCNCQENSVSAPGDCKTADFSVSFFSKKDPAAEWGENAQLVPDSNIYFLAVVKNNTNAEIGNISVSVNIPAEIAFLGNLKINDIPAGGNIISGVNLGFLAPGAEKSITFEGKTQQFNAQGIKEAVVIANSGPVSKTDSIALNLEPNQAEAAVSKASLPFAIVEFLKRWYGWILAAIVPIFLFVVVFRRFSASV